MVFANLQEREKDAFFSLLDEYFQSRPEILNALSSQSNNPAIAATNVAQRAFSAAPTAATSFAKRGLGASLSGGGRQTGTFDEEPDAQPTAGRVAAAAAAFSQHQRGASSTSGSASNKLGAIDTSSLRNAFANRASQGASPPTFNKASAAVRSPPQPDPESEEEEQGEWAEVLYDYVSDEPGDLNIRENQQILIIAKTSDDWWTGEVDGKSGLFPASYVKLL